MRAGATTAYHGLALLIAIGIVVQMFLALMTIQIMLVGARDDAPGLAALHPVLALFVLGLALYIGMPLVSRRRAASAPR